MIAVSVFFIASNLLFRRFDLRDTFDLAGAEKLILRAHGKTNLMRRSYAISKRLARQIDEHVVALLSG